MASEIANVMVNLMVMAVFLVVASMASIIFVTKLTLGNEVINVVKVLSIVFIMADTDMVVHKDFLMVTVIVIEVMIRISLEDFIGHNLKTGDRNFVVIVRNLVEVD